MELITPAPLKSQHDALLADIKPAAKLKGKSGECARRLARLIKQHFAREETFVLPPLGLLPQLAQEGIEAAMIEAIALAYRVRDELPDLLAEQRAIVAALEDLLRAADTDGQSQLVEFGERLLLHEEIEQRVTYPASILVGHYLQRQFNSHKGEKT